MYMHTYAYLQVQVLPLESYSMHACICAYVQVLPLESYGKSLAAQLDWQLHEWSTLIFRVSLWYSRR